MHYSGKFLVLMSHCPTSWWIRTALFLSSPIPALSCPRYFLRIILVDSPWWWFTNSSIPVLYLVLDTSGHLRITCPSSSLTSWPMFLQPGHIFHCLPNLFCIRFPNRRFPNLAMFSTILHRESFTCFCKLNHSDGWGWDLRDTCSLFSSRTKTTALSEHFLLELLEFEDLNGCTNLSFYLQYQLHPRIICSLIS